MSGERGMPTHTVYLTGHDGEKSVFLPQRALRWGQYDDGKMPMAVAYINKNPADLNNGADLEHDRKVNSDGVGLVSNGGAVARYVDLAPGYTCMMHRTQSLDYGLVTDGEAECVLEDGSAQLMRPGDVMVQRYTVHAWRNPSQTAWARVFFVLLDCQPLSINGKVLKEDLGRGAAYVPSSDN